MNKISPSCLQTFNNDLIKGLESLKERHQEISHQVETQELQQQKLQAEIQKLQEQLGQITNQIQKKKQIKLEYATLIEVTQINKGNRISIRETGRLFKNDITRNDQSIQKLEFQKGIESTNLF